MDKHEILVCYSGGQAFIGEAKRTEDQAIVLKNPRIVLQWRDEDGEPAFCFDYVFGFPNEIIFFQYSALWIPSNNVAGWYKEEISGWSSESFSNNELLN